jgi:glucose-6-phosphate isomerase
MPGGFRRKRARDEQRVRVDGNGLRREVVGEQGLADDELAGLTERLDEQGAQLERQRRVGFAELPGSTADRRKAAQLAEEVAKTVTDVVVLGSGDLADGLAAIGTALTVSSPIGAPTEGNAPRLHVLDRLDPDRFTALLATLDLERTVFNVVSATGDALAAMSHFMIARDHLLRDLGAVAYQQHVVVTTRAGDGALRQIVNDEGFRALVLPDAVDESAAVLSAAALFPLACVGVDVGALLAGADAMLERCRTADGPRPAHLLALALRLAPTGVQVVPPGPVTLARLAAWIGRRTRADTADGPPDPSLLGRRVTVLVATETEAPALEIPTAYLDLEGIGYLGGQRLDALIAHERTADELARWNAGELTLTVQLPAVTPHVVGQVVALVEAARILAQPTAEPAIAPDAATRLAYGLVGRPGYEAERAAAQRVAARREERWVA